MNFKIKESIVPVEDATDEDLENRPASYGFWYSIDEGDVGMFVEMLEDEETKKKCYEAIKVLSKLEQAVEDYIVWM